MLNLLADPQQVRHLLITARDELTARGWCQGLYTRSDGAKCIVGAIGWADSGDAEFRANVSAAQIDAEFAIGKAIGIGLVASWNDEVGRTQTEVIAAFNGAIALVDEEIARRAALVEQAREIAGRAGVLSIVNGSE